MVFLSCIHPYKQSGRYQDVLDQAHSDIDHTALLLVIITYRLGNGGARCCRVRYLANIRKDTVTK